jgi:hypothetical protein
VARVLTMLVAVCVTTAPVFFCASIYVTLSKTYVLDPFSLTKPDVLQALQHHLGSWRNYS